MSLKLDPATTHRLAELYKFAYGDIQLPPTRWDDTTFLQHIDVKTLAEQARGQDHRQLKRRLIKGGYEHQISLYGVVHDKTTHDYRPRRIEVLMDAPPTERAIRTIYHFLLRYIPPAPYTIFIYSKQRRALKLVGEYD